jgi:hypothetical protein
MYSSIIFGVKCGEDKVTFVEQRRGVRQGYNLSSRMFNIYVYVDDIVDYSSEGKLHASVVGRKTVPGLVFAADIVISSFTITGQWIKP